MPTKVKRKPKYVPPPKKRFFDRTTIIALSVCIAAILIYIYYPSSDKKNIPADKTDQAGQQGVASEKKDIMESQTFEARADAPSVIKAKLQLESVDNQDKLRVIAEGNTIGNTPSSFRYEWFKNAKPLEQSGDSISGFKRGDKIDVKITPFIGEKNGFARTLSTEIKNSTPKVTEEKKVEVDATQIKYQVKATDPDGDALTYALVDAPQGMTIDSATGLISFPVKDDTPASISFKVKISDGNGGEIVYPLTLSLEKPPEKPAEKAAPAKK